MDVLAPDGRQEFGSREHLFRVLKEMLQQAEFQGSYLDWSAAATDALRADIHDEVPEH
ncbi:hypothetical protein [Bradyrhizobium sp. 33ap4]|uniref:hypothetical protein n=1 Tax=Bradyrhizobium sp. 33ap4 TaxID=3061630 RepID=UPI002930568A|nr:hypothetical protein [Bradyrhizobium sp. 33ap4]